MDDKAEATQFVEKPENFDFVPTCKYMKPLFVRFSTWVIQILMMLNLCRAITSTQAMEYQSCHQ